MRLLVIHPGADSSTLDVYDGYVSALKARGHELIKYRLDSRIIQAGAFFDMIWRKSGKHKEMLYTPADVIYQASVGIYERLARFECDGVLIISAMYVHPDHLKFLRWFGVKTAIVLTESPYDDEKQAPVCGMVDVCWTNERSSLPLLREFNRHTYYLPHAYDPARHTPTAEDTDEDVPAHDVVFVGTGFAERCEILKGVNWDGIDLGIYGTWPLIGNRSKLRKYIHEGTIPNWQAAALYRRAKIGLNLHRTSKGYGRNAPRIEHAESLNPRAYELAAAECFQITDRRAEVGEVFGHALPTFEDPKQLEGAIRAWLAAPESRALQAATARMRVTDHTFAKRAEQMEFELLNAWQVRSGLYATA